MISLTVHGEKSSSYNTSNNYSVSPVGFHSERVYCMENHLGEYCSLIIGRQSNSGNQSKHMHEVVINFITYLYHLHEF